MKNNKDYLDSDFIILYSNGEKMYIPVAEYYIDYLSRQRSDIAKEKIEAVKKYMEENKC